MRTPLVVAASAALALAGVVVPAGAAVEAPVYIEVTAGEAALPGGMVTVTGNVGAGCEEGKYEVFQEYWPEGTSSGSTVVTYSQDDVPSSEEGLLVLAPGGGFSARVGVPADATRSDLYGSGPGDVPHFLWVEVAGCETGAWKRASDRYATSVAVQPLSMLTEVSTAQATVTAGQTLTVTAQRCLGAVATAWAEVGGTRIPSTSVTAEEDTSTVTFAIPATVTADREATATVLCTQSQTADNTNSVAFEVHAVPATPATRGDGASPAGGSTAGGGTGGSTGGGAGASAGGTGGSAGAVATAGGSTAGGTSSVPVAAAATPVSGAVTYAG